MKILHRRQNSRRPRRNDSDRIHDNNIQHPFAIPSNPSGVDAAAEGGKVRVGWNERPQLIGHNPGDSIDLPFKGSAVAIHVIAGPIAGIIKHGVEGSD